MKPPAPPKAVAVEVVAAQPTHADRSLVAQLAAERGAPLPAVAYVVKVALSSVPEATSSGWGLYVGDLRIPKYWQYPQGIYFKVFDPQFFADHEGGKLRFSQDGATFADTGLKLTAPARPKGQRARSAATLPLQEEVLKPSAPAGGNRVRRRPATKRR
jgi:hypothetical protein